MSQAQQIAEQAAQEVAPERPCAVRLDRGLVTFDFGAKQFSMLEAGVLDGGLDGTRDMLRFACQRGGVIG